VSTLVLEGDAPALDAGHISGIKDRKSLLISLANVSLPDFTGTIPEEAFESDDGVYNTWFKSFDAPLATAIGSDAFYHCEALTSVNLPKAITIGGDAFAYCYVLPSVYLPKATTIGGGAFQSCSSLTSVDLPEAITFGEQAFFYCSALPSVYLPKAITFGRFAFNKCENLANIHLPKAYSFGDYVFYSLRVGCILAIDSPEQEVKFNSVHGKPSSMRLYLGKDVNPPRPTTLPVDNTTWVKITWIQIFAYETYQKP
jgi:hypothetical protein